MTSAAAYVSSFLSMTRRMVGERPGRNDTSLSAIRMAMIEQVLDCPPARSRQARVQVAVARTAQQLWLLRGEIYQVISNEFGQKEAERRLAWLEPLFAGHLPAQRGALRRTRA